MSFCSELKYVFHRDSFAAAMKNIFFF